MAYKPKPMRYKADGTPDMRGRRSLIEKNGPSHDIIADTPDEKTAIIRETMGHLMQLYGLPKVTSDDEMLERFKWYFNLCAKDGVRPSVEGLALSTGYAIGQVWEWESGRRKGFSPYTAAIVKNAKNIIQTFDTEMLNRGKLNPVAYIFRAKNYYGMTNKQEVVVTPNVNPTSSPEELIQAAQALPEE
jgi:hypothetical protein